MKKVYKILIIKHTKSKFKYTKFTSLPQPKLKLTYQDGNNTQILPINI